MTRQRFMNYLRRLGCLLLLGLVLPALGQQEPGQEAAERRWQLGLALGRGARDNPLVNGESIDINAVIDFSWYGERFFFDNGDIGFTLHEDQRWSLNLIGTFNNERHFYNHLTGKTFGLESILDNRFGFTGQTNLPDDEKEPDRGATDELGGAAAEAGVDSAAELNARTELPDRDFAFNGGLEFLYISPWGDVQAQVLTDVSTTHNGDEAWLSWSKPWFTRSSQFTLTLGLEWKSDDLVEYYYGVLPEEAFTGRAAYEGAAGTNRFVRFAARHRLGAHWSLVGMIEREFLSAAIRNSPIVDRGAVDTFFAGVFYEF